MKIIKILLLLVWFICPLKSSTHELSDDEYLAAKLKEYHLAIPRKLFRYSYATEVHASCLTESFSLDPAVEEIAKKNHLQLNNSPFFDVSFILQPHAVRAYQLKEKPFKGNVGQLIQFVTQDGLTIEGTYFDRGSDTLVVVGPGFTNEREKMSPYAHIFAEYDVVFFDYRGHGYKEFKLFDPESWNLNPVNFLFGVDTVQARLGLQEELDVKAVVSTMKERKKYRIVAGMGLCYSGLIFVKAQALNPTLFTHLILDGCWLSLGNFTEKLTYDLKLLCTPQRGGWHNFWLTKEEWGRQMILRISEALFSVRFKAFSALDYLPHLNKEVKILFFHGKDDLVISRQEFEIIWQATPVNEKTVILTSNPHVWNHLKQKELYKLISDLFLTSPQAEMLQALHDKNAFIELHDKALKEKI